MPYMSQIWQELDMYFLNYLCFQSNKFDYLPQFICIIQERLIKGEFDYKGIHFNTLLSDSQKEGKY
jgi:hypothetical protein